MGLPNATVTIPTDVIDPIVRQQVCAGIVASLGKPEVLIATVVEQALKQKVDRNGNIDRQSHYNTHDMIEVLSKNAIHAVAKEAIGEWINAQRSTIQAQVQKALSRKSSSFAKTLLDGVCRAIKQEWSFTCHINLHDK